MKTSSITFKLGMALIASIAGCAQRPVSQSQTNQNPAKVLIQPARKADSSNFVENEMVIEIREKRDPQSALDKVTQILAEKWAPTQLKMDAQVWRSALLEWQREPRVKRSLKANLDKAKDLMARGWKYSSRLTSSQAGLVYYLRAANHLHDVIEAGEGSDGYGEALYYSGMNAEVLKEWNLWTSGADYYEACIRYRPYSLLAQKCYSRLQAMNGSNSERIRGLRDLVERQQGQFLDWGFID